MKFASALLLMVAVLLTVSCSGSSEAKTRKEQEAEFSKAFGFSAPPTITTIDYSDTYNRGVMDGSYGQWLGFTFQQAVFDKILLGGYKEEPKRHVPSSSASPGWWPKSIPSGTVVYSRSQEDTPVDEGFQFKEYIWHDRASGLVLFHKIYWD